MSEFDDRSVDLGRDEKKHPRLMARAMRERWDFPGSLRGPLIARLADIVRDPEAEPREVLSAVSAILTASKINLANIALTIKVETHEELERRMTEIERELETAKKRRENNFSTSSCST